MNNIVTMFSAKTVEQGMAALGSIETSWNWVLADREGSIGFQMSGLMPKRREGVSGFVPLPGWEEQNDWQGFHQAEDLPRCLNPECGYFVTSNQDLNEHGNVDPINVGMGPYRSDRIGDLLSENDNITREYMYQLHMDVFSKQAEAFMEILSPLLPDTPNGDMLKQWDFEYTAESKGAYLFDRFYRELFREVFGISGFGEAAVGHLQEHTGIFNDLYTNLAGGPSDRRFSKWYASDLDNWAAGRYKQVRVDAEKAYAF